MTRDEALRVVDVIGQVWPAHKMTDAGVEQVWIPRLVQMDLDVTFDAVDLLIAGGQRFYPAPGIPDLLDAYRAVLRRHADERGLPVAPQRLASVREWQEGLAAARVALAAAQGPLSRSLRRSLPPEPKEDR